MTLTVEDGSGLDDADAYAAIATLSTYHAKYTAGTDWADATSTAQELAIVQATQALDAWFGGTWRGRRKVETQALDWPRSGARDDDGYLVDADSLPVALVNATAVLALKALTATLVPDVTEPSAITSESKSVGPISKSVTYAGAKALAPHYSLAMSLLRELVDDASKLVRA